MLTIVKNGVSGDGTLVSVVCTTYNQRGYIERCLSSLLGQRLDAPYEVIVHDDASDDGTAETVRELAAAATVPVTLLLEDKNVYSTGASIGAVIAPHIKGRYVALCEGDDWWTDGSKLQRQLEYMEANPDCSLCVHAAEVHDEAAGRVTHVMGLGDRERDVSFEEVLSCGHGALFATNSMLMWAGLYLRPEPFVSWAGVGDYPANVYCALSGRVHYLPDVMSAYRFNARGSWSARTLYDPVAHERHVLDMARSLHGFDEATGGAHHALASETASRIVGQWYASQGDWRSLVRGEGRGWLIGLPLRTRAIMFLQMNLPEAAFARARGLYRLLTGKGRDG